MAAKLQCEICGGKLIGKPGGIFECESCGTEYSTEWAKAKIQEITGTVKVEGTVEVTGKVQVDSTANVQSLIKRGNLALEDGKWDEATKCFNDALNADPENAEAYLGLNMANNKCHSKEEFATIYIDGQISVDDKNLKRAHQFAGGTLNAWFNELDKMKSEADTTKTEELAREQEEEKKRLLPIRERNAKFSNLVSSGQYHTVGLKADGTVVALGKNADGQCDVLKWTNTMAVSAGDSHTVGLKSDGTVVTTEYIGNIKFYSGECEVSDWKDIVAISAGSSHTVGLKADGTVVATNYTGDYYDGQCDVSDWKNIVAISAGGSHTIGLKEDGTVVSTGYIGDQGCYWGQCNVKDWTSIVAVSAEYFHTVGLKGDGTVVAVGMNDSHQCNVNDWTDIVAVSAGKEHTVGLKSDGTVVAVGDNHDGKCDISGWTNIVAVSAGADHTLGLKADGTVVAVGDNSDGQCDVTGWKLFKTEEEKKTDYAKACTLQESSEENKLAEAASIFKGLKDYLDSAERAAECDRTYKELKTEREKREKAEREAREARERAERVAAEEKARQERITALNTEKTNLQTELANLKGLFTGKRRKEIEARLAQIDNELKSL